MPKFFVGDLVLVCKAKRPALKLFFTWCGPPPAVAVTSPTVCVVEDLSTHQRKNLQVARLKRYYGKLDDADVPRDVLDLADSTTDRNEIASESVDVGKSEGKL